MKNIKQRSPAQITGDKAVHILHSLLPDEWVIRELQPDYGLDLLIEFFGKGEGCCLATGEFIFAQVKGRKDLSFDHLNKIIRFRIDAALLMTVDLMPEGVPVILLIVDVSNGNAYFLCLNDYIEKHLKSVHPNYVKQKTITVTVPIKNQLNKPGAGNVLQWFGKRRIISKALGNLMISKTREEMLFEVNHLLDEWEAMDMIFDMSNSFSDFRTILNELRNQIIVLQRLVGDDVTWDKHQQIIFDKIRECLIFYEDNCRAMFLKPDSG